MCAAAMLDAYQRMKQSAALVQVALNLIAKVPPLIQKLLNNFSLKKQKRRDFIHLRSLQRAAKLKNIENLQKVFRIISYAQLFDSMYYGLTQFELKTPLYFKFK